MSEPSFCYNCPFQNPGIFAHFPETFFDLLLSMPTVGKLINLLYLLLCEGIICLQNTQDVDSKIGNIKKLSVCLEIS